MPGPLLNPSLKKDRETAIDRYRQLSGTSQATSDVPEAVLAAHHGRVEWLFVAFGVQMWGQFDPVNKVPDQAVVAAILRY